SYYLLSCLAASVCSTQFAVRTKNGGIGYTAANCVIAAGSFAICAFQLIRIWRQQCVTDTAGRGIRQINPGPFFTSIAYFWQNLYSCRLEIFMFHFLLRTIPRPILIKLSLIFQKISPVLYAGNRYEDPINGKTYRKFLPYGYGGIAK